jgi:hypothetical protein
MLWIEERTMKIVGLTVAMIRRCKRALERQVEIEDFEEWQHQKPTLEDVRIRLKVNAALANLR